VTLLWPTSSDVDQPPPRDAGPYEADSSVSARKRREDLYVDPSFEIKPSAHRQCA